MIYSRQFLNFTFKSPEERGEIFSTLIEAVLNGITLTLAEAKFIGTALEATHAEDDEGFALIDHVYNSLDDYKFWQIYMRYAQDLNGVTTIYSPAGVVPNEQKRIEVEYLEQKFIDWKPIIDKTNHKHTVLQFLSKEARDELKEAISWSKQLQEGYRRRLYVEKSTILNSKFVFIKVEEYYQEYDVRKDVITFFGIETVIDGFAYTHILMRHFSPYAKFGRPGLTYHNDPKIDVNNLPHSILYFLEQYQSNIEVEYFNGENIYFNFNNRDYVIWFKRLPRNIKGGGTISYLRVQTFYPAELTDDVQKIIQMILVPVSNNLGYYIMPPQINNNIQ